MNGSLARVAPSDWVALAPWLFAWNRRPGGVHCLHADQGDDLATHTAELAALAPDAGAFWTLDEGAGAVAVFGCEIDAALGRAWLRGPLVEDRAVLDRLLPLFGATLATGLPGIRQVDAFAAADGPWLNAWYAAAGFQAQQLHRVLQADLVALPGRPPRPDGVQPALPDDIAAVTTLHEALFAAAYLRESDFVHALNAPDRVLLVVRDEAGVPLGYLHAEDRPAQHEVYVDYLGVQPERRGRGFGRALLQAALHWAARRGRRQVALTVREDRQRALDLYLAAGFVEVSAGRHWRLALGPSA